MDLVRAGGLTGFVKVRPVGGKVRDGPSVSVRKFDVWSNTVVDKFVGFRKVATT